MTATWKYFNMKKNEGDREKNLAQIFTVGFFRLDGYQEVLNRKCWANQSNDPFFLNQQDTPNLLNR